VKKYVTVQGDMWDSIAYQQLGSTDYTGSLIALNPQYRNFYILPAGLHLLLPDPTPHASTSLPPWKGAVG